MGFENRSVWPAIMTQLWEVLNTNKEWLFSGIGVIVLVTVLPAAFRFVRSKTRMPTGERSLDPDRLQRNRAALLGLVQRTWIEGFLEKSLHGAALIELGMQDQQEAVDHPWGMELRKVSDQPGQVLPKGTKISKVFDDLGGTLLILGEPGSGKTTTLLELARDKIREAEKDAGKPIPLVLNLSSWGDKQPPFTDWLIDELHQKYNVPRDLGRHWLERNELLLLLDGLDEIKPEAQNVCVVAINGFIQASDPAQQLVVCSRSQEYGRLADHLRLNGAVVLQPLDQAQVEAYFEKIDQAVGGDRFEKVRQLLAEAFTDEEIRCLCYDEPIYQSIYKGVSRDTSSQDIIDQLIVHADRNAQLEALLNRARYKAPSAYERHQLYEVESFSAVREILQHDQVLQELTQTPLMLSIISLAYRGQSPADLQALDSVEKRRNHLFYTYVKKALSRRGGEVTYSPEQSIHWLAWLTRQMQQFNQSEFLVENVQLTWLQANSQKTLYMLGMGTILGLTLVYLSRKHLFERMN